MPSLKRVAIVGSGQASAWAIKTLRTDGFDGTIDLIGAEAHLPYERPPLSKQVLAGEQEPSSARIFSEEAYREMGVNLRLGTTATGLNVSTKVVQLSDGETLSFDGLLLATGGAPRRLALSGADLQGVHYLRTIADCEAIRNSLTSNAHILIVGGGWIGLEVAATARRHGARVTLAEYAPRLAGRCVSAEISDFLKELHQDHGVNFRLNARLLALEGAGRVERVRFEDGSTDDISAAVVGIGLNPSTDLAEQAGIAVANGILVNEFWRTSCASVFAAGDVTSFVSSSGARARLESWDNAQKQGIAAAKGMLGQRVSPDRYPWFWSDQYDHNIQLIGETTQAQEVLAAQLSDARARMDIYLCDNTVVGAIAVNAGREMRQLKRLMQAGKPVGVSDLARGKLQVRAVERA